MSAAGGAIGGAVPAPPEPSVCAVTRTPCAIAPPAFVTTAEIVKPCPRLTALGVCTATDRRAASWTFAALAGEAVETAAPLTASVPAASARTESVPVPVPDSTQDQVNVSDAPPVMSRGTGDPTTVRLAPPVRVTESEGWTPRAAACPASLLTAQSAIPTAANST